MKLWIMSDLHFEFMPDGGRRFLEELPDVDHNAAVIAGDLCSFKMIGESLRLCARRFKIVVYVIGNHECYGASIAEAAHAAAHAAYRLHNVDHLEMEMMHMGGRRVWGGTLWFPYSGYSPAEMGMADFWQIRGLREHVDHLNRDTVRFIESAQAGDIIVTHHLPGTASVHPKYAGSPLSDFFVGAAAHVIKQNKPALWVHGHSHESCDHMQGETRVVCNPYGYHGHDVNPNFNPALVAEVP